MMSRIGRGLVQLLGDSMLPRSSITIKLQLPSLARLVSVVPAC